MTKAQELISLLADTKQSRGVRSDTVVYNTNGHDYDGTDYSIGVSANGYLVCCTGMTVMLDSIAEVIDYVS